ncbi:MAG: hypothetical protein LBO82_03775 [Synergistaceae bacterium]|jgi:hypothetical protein|nr:hypothetical protein [Synergistaceae bacterium]
MSEQQNSSSSVGRFAGLGFLIGIPVSYFFQGAGIKKLSLVQYIKAIPEALKAIGEPHGWDMVGDAVLTLVFSCIVCTFLGVMLGNWWDKKKKEDGKTA